MNPSTDSGAAFPSTPETTLNRHPERGVYDRQAIEAVLDEALVCHIGFIADGRPVVVPTLGVRLGSTYYVHGSAVSRMLTTLAEGIELAVAVTLIDGLVLARSVFNHSVNYRSVMIFGRGREVTDADEKWRALEALVEHVVTGRWQDARQPTEHEMKATLVIAVPIEQVSAKIRSGPPKDFEDDYSLAVWAGVVPLDLKAGAPIPDPRLVSCVEPPPAVLHYRRVNDSTA
jgi:nitroimidazol reductase NimA-like FMN-containing flavoprotein (pyridoxamine 5'-phosphate oxidase superfamily)